MALRLKIIGGTPIHGERSLCFSCSNSQVVQGQQVSDLTVRCFLSYEHPLPMPRPVVECSDYKRKNEANKKDMERMAWILETRRGKPIGFVSVMEHKFGAASRNADESDDD